MKKLETTGKESPKDNLSRLEAVARSLVDHLGSQAVILDDIVDFQMEIQEGESRIRLQVTGTRSAQRATAGSNILSLIGADLVQGEKVPNKSEKQTVGAITKRINRTDPEFATLIVNNNPAIVFKDEEATGADRRMTAKLRDGIDQLAVLVSQEWAGTKLRVTEAWDEDGEHSAEALHYEGRAADLTTFPIDGNKLGRLGRLAVEAGLGWVFFEDSKHIHVSVSK